MMKKQSATLLIDVGNSYLKWAYVAEGELSGLGRSAHDAQSLPFEAAAVWRTKQPTRIVVSNVAGQALACALVQWFESQWQRLPEFVSISNLADYGLKTKYRDTSRLGIDRILVLIAARQWAPVCVIDCGTAVTIDVLTQQNTHLGGAILPGLGLMRDALLNKAAGVRRGVALASVAPETGFLGQDTASCIEKGAHFAVVGAIAHYTAELRRQLGEYRCVITGGDALAIQSALKDGYHVVPNLVLHGLRIVADQNR